MKALLLIGLLLTGVIFAQTPAEVAEASAKWNTAYQAAVDRAFSEYPDLQDDSSRFRILLDHRVDVAILKKDPAMDDPNFIARWADEMAAELRAIGRPVSEAAKDPQAAPSPAPVPVTPAPARAQTSDEFLQDYFAKVARGEAGMDPKLQTRARSGDVYAQQEIERRRSLQGVTASVNAGTLSAEAAAAERAAIDQRHAQAVQQLQLNELIEEQERLKWSLQRLQQEQERRRRHR